MQEFRKNCYGTAMEQIWTTIADAYVPSSPDALRIFGEYQLGTDGSAVLDTLLASSAESSEIYDLKEPLVAVKLHTALSILTHRTPDLRWDSENAKYEKNVPVLNALRKHDWSDDQTKGQYIMMWFYDVLFGTTFWRRYYEKLERSAFFTTSVNLADGSSEEEERTVVEFDGITAEALSPLQVWIDENTSPLSPRSMRNVLYRKTYTYDNFIRRFSGVQTEAWLLANVKPSTPDPEGMKPRHEKDMGTNMVTCYYYEDKDLDLYYVVANDVEVVKEHLPWNHKELSVQMGIWMPRGEKNPYGLGPIELMMEDKRALDEFKSMTFTQAKFSIYKAMFYTGTLGSEGEGGDFKVRPDHAYKMNSNEKPTFMEVPGPGEDSWRAIGSLRERIDDASGINRPLGGEIVKSTTAFQTDLAKDAALARMSVPIDNIASLLVRDAYLMLELQRQHYTLPEIEELVKPEDVIAVQEELEAAARSGSPVDYDLWVDETPQEEDPEALPKFYKGTYRSAQLNVERSADGAYTPSLGKASVVLTSELFAWKGKFFVVTDSMLSITPSLDSQRKLEAYNMLIPMFEKPPQMVAKPARELAKLYGLDYRDVFPQEWLVYLESLDTGQQYVPPQPMGDPAAAQGGTQPSMPGFQQEGAPTVVTNTAGQKDAVSARSEAISP